MERTELIEALTEDIRKNSGSESELCAKYGISIPEFRGIYIRCLSSKNRKRKVPEAMLCSLPECSRDHYQCTPSNANCAKCGWNIAVNDNRREEVRARYAGRYA